MIEAIAIGIAALGALLLLILTINVIADRLRAALDPKNS